MQSRTIDTGAGWNDTTRDIEFDDIFRVGQLLAGADGNVETFEPFEMASKANFCREHGFARAYCVNGGAPMGAILVEINQTDKTRASIVAHYSGWGIRAKDELMADAKVWAQSVGVTLGQKKKVEKVVYVEEWAPV